MTTILREFGRRQVDYELFSWKVEKRICDSAPNALFGLVYSFRTHAYDLEGGQSCLHIALNLHQLPIVADGSCR